MRRTYCCWGPIEKLEGDSELKIVSVTTVPFTIPYREKNWRIASGSIRAAELVFVRLETDEGISGIGCTSPGALFISGENVSGICDTINALSEEVLLGRDPFDVERLLFDIDQRARLNNRAKAGIDLALYDLLGKALEIPVCKLLGGTPRTGIPVMRILGMQAPALMAETAIKLVQEGYKYLKLKMGSSIAEDEARIRAIREAVGSGVRLTVDLNGAYDHKAALKVMDMLKAYDVEAVEQPLPAWDLEGLAELRRRSPIKIEVDESVLTVQDAVRVIKKRVADLISIKLLKVGGISKARRLAALCEAFGVGIVIGSTPASQLVDAANAHFISGTPGIKWACEIGEFVRMEGDPVSGLGIKEGSLNTPDGPGYGVTISDIWREV